MLREILIITMVMTITFLGAVLAHANEIKEIDGGFPASVMIAQ